MSRSALIAFALLAALATTPTSQNSGAAGMVEAVMPQPADSFADAVGVNTHFGYQGSSYIVAWPKVSSALLKSGFRHIRDGAPSQDSTYIERLRYLGEHGIKHSVGFAIGDTPSVIRGTLDDFRPYVDAVEPNNEYDEAARKDPDWVQHVTSEQRTLYAIVHGQRDFDGITVLGPSLAHTALFAQLGDLDAYEDAGNVHSYICRRDPQSTQVARTLTFAHASTRSKPIWTTETGYGDDPTRNCWLPDDVIAKYDPRVVAEGFNAGQPRIYFYQFVDTPGDPGFGATGLLKANGEAKPQYTALVSLISLLSDPGPVFALKALRYAVESPVPDVDHLLLEKRGGIYELLLWQEVGSYRDTPAGGTRIPIAPVTVNISIIGAHGIKYYTYDSTWSLIAATIDQGTANSIRLPVTDSISVLEIH
jgi:hypothetical protein